MNLRFVIIEDEPPARIRLKRLLKELRPDAVCAGEAEDGHSALGLLASVSADVLFLDIEFPPEGAFGLLRQARETGVFVPPIIFVTAFDRFALEAFRWAARDYLLKPINRQRLEEALGRIERQVNRAQELEPLLEAHAAARQQLAPSRFTVLSKGCYRVFSWSEVSHISTENRLVSVHTQEGRFTLDRTLEELEKLLAPRFIRCHRGALVALDRIRELIPEGGGSGELRLDTGQRVPVSRDRMTEVRRHLG